MDVFNQSQCRDLDYLRNALLGSECQLLQAARQQRDNPDFFESLSGWDDAKLLFAAHFSLTAKDKPDATTLAARECLIRAALSKEEDVEGIKRQLR